MITRVDSVYLSKTLQPQYKFYKYKITMESLKGKNALITGAGRGIGMAVALALANEGVNIGMIARTEKDLDGLSTRLLTLNVKVSSSKADVSSITEVNASFQKITAELGPIDILVNNAGIATFGTFTELEPDQWEQIIKVNLFGAYYAVRAVLPSMIERKTGDIINIASTAAMKPSAITSAYSASKAGLNAMTESLMLEARKYNIRVTCLNPSTIATGMAMDLKLTDGNPERVMQPEDFAELITMQLKLNRRVFVREASIWSTNP